MSDLRTMAASGMTRAQMARTLGIPQTILDRQLRKANIFTHGKRGVAAKPKADAGPVHGCSGEKPPKLMPSAEALARASIWSFAVHDRSVFCTPD